MSKNPKVTLKEKMHFESTTPAGDWIIPLDSDPEVGGEHRGHRPLMLLVVGLMGCMSMDTVSILRKKRQDVQFFDVEMVDHDRAGGHPNIYTRIHLHFRVGGEVTPEAIERSIQLSIDKYCPAFAMLQSTTKMETTYEIVEVPDLEMA